MALLGVVHDRDGPRLTIFVLKRREIVMLPRLQHVKRKLQGDQLVFVLRIEPIPSIVVVHLNREAPLVVHRVDERFGVADLVAPFRCPIPQIILLRVEDGRGP